MSRAASRSIAVAVPVPALGLLTYGVPEGIDVPPPGVRVLVPLGARQVTGVVAAAGAPPGPPPEGIRDLIDVLDGSPFVPAEVMRLALWAADYYACSPGEAVAAAMPPLAWVASECRVQLTERGRTRDVEVDRHLHAAGRDAVLAALADGRWTATKALTARLAGAGHRGRRSVPVRAIVRLLESDGLVRTEIALRGRASAFKTVRAVELTQVGRQLADRAFDEAARAPDSQRLGGRQRAALRVLFGSPVPLSTAQMAREGVSSDTLARLRRRGALAVLRVAVDRDPFGDLAAAGVPAAASTGDRRLTPEQAVALDRLTALGSAGVFRVALLHGVTGSGKTEVYLRLSSVVRARGRSVLVLVPEIALTPALTTAFREVFGDRVAIQHSGLSDGERHDQWQRIRGGRVDIVVGTRSAIFAPLSSPGLIIVDEEHDPSYKQEESPRYHARDLAVVRGRLAGGLVVLGSATPSLESFSNARSGRYELVTLERRVLDRPLASVRLVNMRDEYAEVGPDAVLSRELSAAIAQRVASGEQALVLLNRRGFATAVFCRQCGATLECPNCSVSLTVHGDRAGTQRARCHYCNYSGIVPASCRRCAGPYLLHTGFGTQRVEQEIRLASPGARVARLDRDTARTRGAPAALLGRFARGEIDVLVGTQMIAKGHDFPGVTLVGVVSADVGLGLADFRAAERTFQLLTQVVGRSGRGELAGEAIIQTLFPDHYSIQHACRQDYLSFYEDEVRFRRSMRYPPAVGLVNVIVRGRSLCDAMAAAGDLVRRTKAHLSPFPQVTVLGPAPAPFVKIRGESRVQFLLKGPRRSAWRAALDHALAERQTLRRKVSVDVDPMSVL